MRGWHLREFGFRFPKGEEKTKRYKWKKTNFTTDLPKHDRLCTYLVAKTTSGMQQFRMHVVASALEYSQEYRNPEVLKAIRGQPSKLLLEDQEQGTERVLLCHCRKVARRRPEADLQVEADETVSEEAESLYNCQPLGSLLAIGKSAHELDPTIRSALRHEGSLPTVVQPLQMASLSKWYSNKRQKTSLLGETFPE